MRKVDRELWDACVFDNPKEAREAILRGADVNVAVERGQTPLYWTCFWHNKQIIRLLISKGANINAKSDDGWTALRWACRNGDKALVEELISKGADIAESLQWAIDHQKDDIVVMLLEEMEKCEK